MRNVNEKLLFRSSKVFKPLLCFVPEALFLLLATLLFFLQATLFGLSSLGSLLLAAGLLGSFLFLTGRTDGASCYLVDILIGKDGQISMKLLEY